MLPKAVINISQKFVLTNGSTSMSAEKIAEYFLGKKSKNSAMINRLVKSKEKYYAKNNSFKLYAGIKQLLPYLKKKGYLLGLVSGANYERISDSLKTELLKYFDIVIAGNKIKECKPHPQPYLTAAQNFNLEPSQCLAVENAPLGIESAKRAGMQCVAVCSTLDRKYLKKADIIIDKLTELKNSLDRQKECI